MDKATTHYLMLSNRAETACGLSNVPAVAAKPLVNCSDCLERITRWSAARDAAKAAWYTRTAR
jgi:hypothetical protein